MKVLHYHLPRRRRGCIATIGVFDGIHHGHRYLLRQLTRQAGRRNLAAVVITFDVAPQQFLQKFHLANAWSVRKRFSGYITDRLQKVAYIAACGVDYLWFLRTNRRLLELTGRDFIAYICKYFLIKKLIVGEDFRFGYAGSCGVNDLKRLSREFGFSLQILRKRSKNKKIISSSLIRELIQEGRVKELISFLGRPFALRAKVEKGRRVGRRLGFPTANISSGDYVVPLEGVYAGYALVQKKLFLAAIFVSRKKVRAQALLEAYLIGFHKNILGQMITIIFLEYLRKKRTFSSLVSLREAIKGDVDYISAKYSIAKAYRTQPLVL